MYMTLSAGNEEWYVHEAEGGPSYDDLKRHVGEGAVRDLFDVVSLPNGIDLWVNDEGLLENLPWSLCIEWGAEGERTQPLCGTVVAARSNAEGETIGLEYGDKMFLQGHDSRRGHRFVVMSPDHSVIPVLFVEDIRND